MALKVGLEPKAVRAIRNSLEPAIPKKYDPDAGGTTRLRLDRGSDET